MSVQVEEVQNLGAEDGRGNAAAANDVGGDDPVGAGAAQLVFLFLAARAGDNVDLRVE